ncbi:hypothetical protein NMY22_g4544 [Coprinellus aureogranulatus]|nr:hypothetical protein NMY22_g4544 [Coprinellus aureogranulatus]
MSLDQSSLLFPAPTRSNKDPSAPRFWPGRTAETTRAVTRILRENNRRFEIFHGPGFHNHAPHTVLSLWALGANERLLHAAYSRASDHLVPQVGKPAIEITKSNWTAHLADGKNYAAYLRFFGNEIQEKGVDRVVNEFMFSQEADEASMGRRVFDRLYHPMIHIGYGLEFNILGTVAEGLAEAAVHPTLPSVPSPDESVSHSLDTLGPQSRLHALDILGHVTKLPKLAIDGNLNLDYVAKAYPEAIKRHGIHVFRLLKQWDLETSTLQQAAEDLAWVVTLIYGVAGRESSLDFNADFAFMHFVTSATFLPNSSNPSNEKYDPAGEWLFSTTKKGSLRQPRISCFSILSNPSPTRVIFALVSTSNRRPPSSPRYTPTKHVDADSTVSHSLSGPAYHN